VCPELLAVLKNEGNNTLNAGDSLVLFILVDKIQV
jgi:hypothetical protein